MAKRKKPTETKRDRVLRLLKAGYVTQSEAADLVGVSRQRIHQWVAAARVYPSVARARHLKALLHDHSGVQL